MARIRRILLSDAAGSLLLFLNAFRCPEVMTAIMCKLSCRVKFPHGTNPTNSFIRCGWHSASISECLLWPRGHTCNNVQTELQGEVSPWHESDEFFYQMRLALCFYF